MPVEIRELIIRASIEQKPAKVEGLVDHLTYDQIEKINFRFLLKPIHLIFIDFQGLDFFLNS